MIEIITKQDLLGMNKQTEYGIFTPLYEYKSYNQKTETYQGFKIIKTAQQVYDEWLVNKDRPQEPNKMEVLEKQVKELTQENIKCQQTIADMEIELLLK